MHDNQILEVTQKKRQDCIAREDSIQELVMGGNYGKD